MVGCSKKQNTETELITEYYKGFQTSNYQRIKNVVSDSLTTVSGDFTSHFTPQSYYKQFKWDSVFKPKYELISLNQKGKEVLAIVSISSSKFEFLKNNPMILSYQFQFQSGKISRIKELDSSNVNWKVWAKEVNTLVNWIKINHPELDGFVYDLSMQGAQNYLKAIELYKNRYKA
jgi:hypothetical protein